MDVLYENGARWIAQIFIILAVTANYYEFKKLLSEKRLPFKFLIMPMIYTLLSPLLYLSLPFLAIYRQVVNIVLTIKHGSKYGGLLAGTDIIINLENIHPIQALYVIEYNTKEPQPFDDFVRDILRKGFLTKFKEETKVFGALRKFMGYSYLLKNEVKFDDCFGKLRTTDTPTEEMTTLDLTRIMTDNMNMPLPSNSNALWEILVGTQPIKDWKKNVQDDSIRYYPIVVKVHHVVGDGVHMFKAIVELLIDEEVADCANSMSARQFLENARQIAMSEAKKVDPYSIPEIIKTVRTKLESYMKQGYAFVVSPGVGLAYGVLTKTKPNLLQGPTLTNQIYRCLTVEETPRYVRTVRRIKRKYPGTTFEDIFVTAFTASLSEHYRKHSAPIPDYLLAPTAVSPEAAELLNFILSESKGKNTQCKNSALVNLRTLPVGSAIDNSITSLANTLELVKQERCFISKSIEITVSNVVRYNIVKFIPELFIAMMMKEGENLAVSFSNVPGPPNTISAKGCPILDMVAFPGHGRRRGIGFMIITYGDRISLGFSVDKALIPNEQEAQDVLDRVYHYIDILDKENPPEKTVK